MTKLTLGTHPFLLGFEQLERLAERAANGRRVPVPAILAILIATVLGVVDECLQAFLPQRVFDPRDLLFNTLAAVMAVSASSALLWARSRRRR